MTALGDDATVPKILVPSDGTRVGKGLSIIVRVVPHIEYCIFRDAPSPRSVKRLARTDMMDMEVGGRARAAALSSIR